MGPEGYGFDHLTSTRVENGPGTLRDDPRFAEPAGEADGAGRPGASSSGATNSARTPSDCPGCLALRGTSRLLAESALYLIDRNAELTRQLEAYRKRDRRHAELLSGLADLQRAEACG